MHGKGRELNVRGMVLVFSSFWEVVEAIWGQKWDFTTAAVPMNVSIKGGRPVVKGIRFLKSSFTHNQSLERKNHGSLEENVRYCNYYSCWKRF